MTTELRHEDSDVDPGEIEPVFQDLVTSPSGFAYLTLEGDFLTFGGTRLMIADFLLLAFDGQWLTFYDGFITIEDDNG